MQESGFSESKIVNARFVRGISSKVVCELIVDNVGAVLVPTIVNKNAIEVESSLSDAVRVMTTDPSESFSGSMDK